MTKLILTTLMTLFISAVCFGQEQFVEDENWLGGFNSEADYDQTLVYWAAPFSTEDLTKAKQRLKIIRQSAPENEWEGVYTGQMPVGSERLVWSRKSGFFHFYFYHALRSINYGTVEDTSDAVSLVSEKPFDPVKKRPPKKTYVKVKFGERSYLIPEINLRDFCERAVGVNTDLNYIDYFFEKEGNYEEKVFGLPAVPEKYKHLIRLPIETKIISVGKRKIMPNEDVHYFVTLDAGANKKLKIGMNFYAEDLGEWVKITKVLQKTANGFIRRNFDEDSKSEQCRDSEGGSGQIIPCKEIKAGMKVKTKTSENYF